MSSRPCSSFCRRYDLAIMKHEGGDHYGALPVSEARARFPISFVKKTRSSVAEEPACFRQCQSFNSRQCVIVQDFIISTQLGCNVSMQASLFSCRWPRFPFTFSEVMVNFHFKVSTVHVGIVHVARIQHDQKQDSASFPQTTPRLLLSDICAFLQVLHPCGSYARCPVPESNLGYKAGLILSSFLR